VSEIVALISRISVTYVKVGPNGEHQSHMFGLTSKINKQYIRPDRFQELLNTVSLCCEDILAQKDIAASDNRRGDHHVIHEEDDGHRTVTTTESDSASHQ
jgi:hypothetical protein